MLPLLLRVLDARAMTGSEAQRKLLLGHATLLAYCLRWQEFRVCPWACSPECGVASGRVFVWLGF